jgi:uncharacterized membrane protein
MPFCASCGSPVEGRFCAKCGTPMGAAPASGGPAPAYNPPPGGPQSAGSGMTDNVAGALCYIVGFITGILFLVLEPYSKRPFVRFHAFQSIFFSVGWILLSIGLSIAFTIAGFALHMWFIFLPLRLLIGLLGFVLWLFCMYKAYQGEWYQLPIAGPIAARQAGAAPGTAAS